MPLRNDVERRADPEALGALGYHRSEKDAVRHDLVALILEVVLGKPVGVVAEGLTQDGRVDNPFCGLPDRFLAVASVGRRRRTSARIVHLHPAK